MLTAVTAPIVIASHPAQLAELLQATEVKLDGEEIAELETDYLPHHVVGFR
ncbi:hypothetical protein [Sodalis-like endosymbiont of Proechinophthirus fluctus]|uniref:hypothetical protein n=1 Tax=Sodalis-like endosymbiont of Proechinophthirus fluctus TaxID=1462730 RepID=UPI003F750DFF